MGIMCWCTRTQPTVQRRAGEAVGHQGGAERKRTAAWRMGEPRRSFMSELYGGVGRLHTPALPGLATPQVPLYYKTQ
jgi:hypothetical protein